MMNNQRWTRRRRQRMKKIKICRQFALGAERTCNFFLILFIISLPHRRRLKCKAALYGWNGRGGADYPDHFLFIAVSHKPCAWAWRRIDVRKMLLIYEANELGTLGADFFFSLSRVSSSPVVLSRAHTARANVLPDWGWMLFVCVCVAHGGSMTIPSSRNAHRHIHIHQWTDIFSS